MNPHLFQRIKTRFESLGGVIDQSDEAQRYLRSRKAEAATFNHMTIILKPHPTNAEVFEELIHTAQYRNRSGRARGDNVYEMEVEAIEKLLRCRIPYKLTAEDVTQLTNRLNNLRRILRGEDYYEL